MGPWILAWMTMEWKKKLQGKHDHRQARVASAQAGPAGTPRLTGHLPARFAEEVEKSTVSSAKPHLLCLHTSPHSSQQLLRALDSTLDAEFDRTKGPLFHGGRNPDVRVILLESSEENPQLTWMWPCSPGSLQRTAEVCAGLEAQNRPGCGKGKHIRSTRLKKNGRNTGRMLR